LASNGRAQNLLELKALTDELATFSAGRPLVVIGELDLRHPVLTAKRHGYLVQVQPSLSSRASVTCVRTLRVTLGG
jgi:hypothetical protein